MIDCKFKEGNLFKEPIYIEEDLFMLSYKAKLKKIGIDYIPPDKDDDIFGNLFN